MKSVKIDRYACKKSLFFPPFVTVFSDVNLFTNTLSKAKLSNEGKREINLLHKTFCFVYNSHDNLLPVNKHGYI